MNSVKPKRVRSAAEATKILMDKLGEHNLKRSINKKNSKFISALPSHVRNKNREEIRKQLRIMSMHKEEETIIEEPDYCDDEIEHVLIATFSNNVSESSERLSCPDDIPATRR